MYRVSGFASEEVQGPTYTSPINKRTKNNLCIWGLKKLSSAEIQHKHASLVFAITVEGGPRK
jgi:hypothetical protein